MKKTFQAVRKGDVEAVKRILEKNPDEIHAVAKQPPKKDDGQSLLQVALKTGNIAVVHLLLDHHADVHFMESEDCCNTWRAPVIHDAIRCAVMRSRWNAKNLDGDYVQYNTAADADEAFGVLKRMFELGADVAAKDSFGNTGLERAILDAKQILPRFHHGEKIVLDDRLITEELRFDLHRIFGLLFAYGADTGWIARNSGKTIWEWCEGQPVAEFLIKPL